MTARGPAAIPQRQPPGGVQAAWRAGLAAEYAAVFGYGVLGPRLQVASEIGQARRFEAEHRALVAQTSAMLVAAGLTPGVGRASYPLPFPVDDVVAARRLALRLEDSASAAWRYLLAEAAAVPGQQAVRAAALSTLTASAVRAVSWRRLVSPAAPSVPFPGISAG
jgi:Domain of unknown function (DUF4439)